MEKDERTLRYKPEHLGRVKELSRHIIFGLSTKTTDRCTLRILYFLFLFKPVCFFIHYET